MDACNLPELLAQDLDVAEPVFAAKKMTAGAPRRASTIDLDLEEEDKLLPLPSDPRRSPFGAKIHPFPFSSAFSLSSDQPTLGLGLSTSGGDDNEVQPDSHSRPVSLTHGELLARLRPTSAVGPHGLRGPRGLNGLDELDEFNDFSDLDEGGDTAVLVVPGPGNAPFPPYSRHHIESDIDSGSDSDSDSDSVDSFEIPSIGLYAPHRARREQERLQKEKEQLQLHQQQQRRKQETLQEQRQWQQQQEELQQQQQRLLLLQQQQQILQHLLLAHASGGESIRSMDSSGTKTDGLRTEDDHDIHGSHESLFLPASREGSNNNVVSDRLSISSVSSVEEAIPFDISRRGNSVITTATSVSSVARSSSQSHTLPALGPSTPHKLDKPSYNKKDSQASFCSWSHDDTMDRNGSVTSGQDGDRSSRLGTLSHGLAKPKCHNPLSSWMDFDDDGDDDSDSDNKQENEFEAVLETQIRSVTPGPESQSMRSFSPCNSLPTRPSTALGWIGKTAGEPRYSFSSWPEQQKNRLAQSAASSASIHPALRRSASMNRRMVTPTKMDEPPLLLPKQYQPPQGKQQKQQQKQQQQQQQQQVSREPTRSSSVRSHVSESLNALIGAPTARRYRQSMINDDAFLPEQISSAPAYPITPSKQVKFDQSALRSQFDYDDDDDDDNENESIMQSHWSKNSGEFSRHPRTAATLTQTAWHQLAQHSNREFAILPADDGGQHLGDNAIQQSVEQPQVMASIQPLAAALPSPMVVGIPLPREVIETLRVSVSCFPETMLSLSSFSIQTIRSYSHKIHRCSQPEPGSTHRTIFSLTTSSILPPSPTVASSFHSTAQDWSLSVADPAYASETSVGSTPLPSSSYRRFWKRLVPSRSSPTVGSHGDGSGLMSPQTPPATRRTFSGRTSGHDDTSFLSDDKDQQMPDGACLKRIFPTGSDYLCDALYAHIVAYNYISLLCPAVLETTETIQPPPHGQSMQEASDATVACDNNNILGDKKRKRQTIRVYVAPDVAVPPTARFLSPEPPRSELLSSPSPPPFFEEEEEEGEESREAVLPLSHMETPPPSRGGGSGSNGRRDTCEEDSRYISRKAALFLGISSSLVDENLQSSASARARAAAAAEAANSAAGSVGSAGGLTRRYNSLRQRRRQRQNGEFMDGEDTLSVAVLSTRTKTSLSSTPSSLKSAKVRKIVSKQPPSVPPLLPLAIEETVADAAMCDLQAGLASCIHQLVSTLTAAKTLSQLQDQESLTFEFADMAKDANPMFIRTLCELVRSQEEQF